MVLSPKNIAELVNFSKHKTTTLMISGFLIDQRSSKEINFYFIKIYE